MNRISSPALHQPFCGSRRRLARLTSALLVAALMTGCGAIPDRNAASLDLTKESIVVMSMHFANEHRPKQLLYSMGFAVNALDHPEQRSHTNAAQHGAFGVGPAQKIANALVQSDRGEALLVMRLPPGRFNLNALFGSTVPYGQPGSALHFNVKSPFEVRPQSVMYLGHLELLNKKKASADEQSSGASPLNPGFMDSTLDVKLKDRYLHDLAWLHRDYPVTRTAEVVRSLLPALWLARAVGSTAEPIKVVVD